MGWSEILSREPVIVRTLVILILSSVLLAAPAWAQIPPGMEGPFEPHSEGNEAISLLRSPYCPGRMLSTCPSPMAGLLRDSIQMLAHGGWPADSIVEWMLANHGEEWRALPKAEGRGLLAWLVPPIALVLGIGLFLLVLRRMRGGPVVSEAEVAPVSEEERERLKEAIREMESSEEMLL